MIRDFTRFTTFILFFLTMRFLRHTTAARWIFRLFLQTATTFLTRFFVRGLHGLFEGAVQIVFTTVV